MAINSSTAAPTSELPPRSKRSRRGRRLLTALGVLLALLAVCTVWTNTHPYTLTASVEIEATPQETWKVLTDLPAYEQWNPFITSAKGAIAKGETLTLVMHDSAGDTTFTPTVLTADRGKELRWLGKVGPGWIADGEHSFTIEPLANGKVRLTQTEHFTGVAVPFYRSTLHSNTLPQFQAMNRALTERITSLRLA